MVKAVAGLLGEYGGQVHTRAPVRRILTSADRATGVELDSGAQIHAKRAVIANITPTLLFEHLLPDYPLSEPFRTQVKRYTYGPATMMVHLALSGRLHWVAGEEVANCAYVHIAPYIDDLDRTYTEALAGYLPSNPFLIVGQTSVVDPSRAPEGQHVLWIQVRALPAVIEGDVAREIAAQRCQEAKEPFADRVIQKLASYAPNIQDLILAWTVFSPQDLEEHNPNLAEGDSVAGSHHLFQNFIYRPFPGWSTYRMPIEGLYMVGAATWPGAGTNAIAGYLTAHKLLHSSTWRNRLIGGGVIAGAATAAGIAAARWLERTTV
jgi:phytoene dehydrogenase-like protein